MKKGYFKKLDILRILLCLSILLYHLNIINGGFLAVCSFFVLSGYLAVRTSFKEDKFNLFKYYLNRIKKIYIPLLVTVFISILIISCFNNINWINLKPESTSVILNYNNYWQLDANLDYFTHHITSPFTHLWYISILIQFELIFPIIFIIFKFLGKRISKYIPCELSIVLAIISYLYFIKLTNVNIMNGYYNSFARFYALFIGMALGYIHHYYKPLIIKYFKYVDSFIYIIYLLIISILFTFIKVSSNYYILYMLLICLLTCRIIDYSVNKESKINKFINSFSNISYEIYLVQYPIIFLFTYYKLNIYLKNIIVIILTILISYIIHFALNIKNKPHKILRSITLLIILTLVFNGSIVFANTKDYTKDFNNLEKTLDQNEELMQQKQKEYQNNYQKQQDEWNNILNNLDTEEDELKQMVINLPIVGVGDSVMLGAVNELYVKFPNSYFDAKISRTDYEANGILQDLKNRNMLGNPIIINLGTNGQCGNTCRMQILNTIGERHIYWVNVTNDNEVHVNADLANFANNNSNVTLIDWNNISKGHPEYFIADGIHLTPDGRNAYVEAIYEAILNDYINEFNIKKQETIDAYENEKLKQITIYGNTLLINSYKDIEKYFENANYIINEHFDYKTLKNEIKKDIDNKSLSHNLIFIFDNSFKITNDEFIELTNILKDNNIYFIILNDKLKSNKENIHIINFQKEIDKHNDYLMIDKKHLTNKGSYELAKLINNYYNK